MNSKMQRKGKNHKISFYSERNVKYYLLFIISVLVMQARKKRYKAAKARMKPDDSKTKPKRYGISQLTSCSKESFSKIELISPFFLLYVVGVCLVLTMRITKWVKIQTTRNKRIREIT